MAGVFPAAEQRSALLVFASALGSRAKALRRDECGDWRIAGSKGHIYAVPEGFQIMIMGWSGRGWAQAKRAFAFGSVTQDGDDEGGFIVVRPPTPEEAEAIRHFCGIAKRAEYSDGYRAELRERVLRARQQMGKKPASDAGEGE